MRRTWQPAGISRFQRVGGDWAVILQAPPAPIPTLCSPPANFPASEKQIALILARLYANEASVCCSRLAARGALPDAKLCAKRIKRHGVATARECALLFYPPCVAPDRRTGAGALATSPDAQRQARAPGEGQVSSRRGLGPTFGLKHGTDGFGEAVEGVARQRLTAIGAR